MTDSLLKPILQPVLRPVLGGDDAEPDPGEPGVWEYNGEIWQYNGEAWTYNDDPLNY